MKILIEFLPIVIFFVAFKAFDIYVATTTAMVVALLQVIYDRIWLRRWVNSHLLTFAVIGIFGGATLLLQDEVYIKWKPTVINGLFALAFLASQFVGKRTLVERMLGKQIDLPATHWLRLNLAWVLFFAFCGLLNIYVMRNFDTETWVNFKLFGLLGLTILFIIAQTLYVSRSLRPEAEAEAEAEIDDGRASK